MGHKLIVSAVIGLVLCTVALQEFPELIHLADDTTNNFTLSIPSSETATSPESEEPRQRKVPVTRPLGRSVAYYREAADLNASRNILRLICILQT